MKFSAQEEYGLRCLIRIAKLEHLKKGLTIPEISQSEGISQHNVAKILRLLRLGGFLDSERGQSGGYTLARPAKEILINEVLYSLGGRLYDETFCESHSGIADICTNSIDCSVRSVWKMIQRAVDDVVSNLTLHDLLGAETSIIEKSFNNFSIQSTQK